MGHSHQRASSGIGAPAAGEGWARESFTQARGNAAAQDELAAKTGIAAFQTLGTGPAAEPGMGNAPVGRAAIQGAVADAQRGDFQAGAGRISDPYNNADLLAQVGATHLTEVATLRAQLGVVQEMRAVVPNAHFPPTPDELETWFRSVDNNERRGAAEGMFTRYTEAFHVHANVAGQPTDDIVYDPRGHAATATNGESQQVHGPTRWAQALQRSTRVRGEGNATPGEQVTDAAHRGRYVNDCEGYAFMSDRLMRAAGYQVSHITGDERGGPGLHAMTRLTDPHSGRSRVQSNTQFFDDEVSGYRFGAPSTRPTSGPTFYRGSTQNESLANLAAAQRTQR